MSVSLTPVRRQQVCDRIMRTAAKVHEYGDGSVWATRVARDLAEQMQADAALCAADVQARYAEEQPCPTT